MLEHVVLFVIGLFAVYCAGRLLRPAGDFYATLFGVAGRLGLGLRRWLERFGASPQEAQSSRSGLRMAARLVGLVVALAVLAGEFVSSYAASPTLFGQESGTAKLPADGLAAPALAVLFFSLCAVFGICTLEAAEWVPPEVWLFNVPQSKRRAFRWFAGCSLAVSILAMALFYAERTFYLLDSQGDITVALQIATFVLLGLLVGAAGLVALWMVTVGLQALAQLVLATAAFAASAVVDVAEFLGRHFRRRPDVHMSEDGIDVPAHLAEIGEASMNQQCVGVYYGGPFGLQMRTRMEPALKRLHAADLVGSGGLVSLDRLVEPVSVGRDVSPPWPDQERVLAGAATQERGYTEIFNRLGAAICDANVALPSTGSSLWFFLDPDVLPFAVEMLRTVNRQLPHRAIAVVTQTDDSERRSGMTRKGLRELRDLWEEGVIATTFVVSAQSAFSMTVKHTGGERKQMEFMAQTLTALLLAGTDSPLNRSCVEVLRALGRLSPFVGCAFTSDRLSPLRLPWIRALQQWLRGDNEPVGDRENMRLQAEHVTRQVLTDPDCQAIQEGIRSDWPALLVCTVPLRWRDWRFGAVQEALMTFLGRSFPGVVSVMVRGNGVPMHVATDPLDRYYVQASCVYPLAPDFFEGGWPELAAAQERTALPGSEAEGLIDGPKVSRTPSQNGAGARRR